jgi:hypothetical protein
MSINGEKSPVDEIITDGENQTVEFKKSDILSDPIKLAKEMVAFANSIGGRILIGVCDNGTIEGMKAKKEHELFLMNIARDRCDPPLAPSFSTINKPQGDIYELKVTRFRTFPHAVKTESGRVYYIRVGTTVREVSSTELALLFESSKEEMAKKPDLELFLVDNEGNTTRSITANPVFTIVKKIKVEMPPAPFSASFAAIKNFSNLASILPFTEREPSPDLVPISIELSNRGQAPAQEITIFMEFPDGCEVINKRDAIGGVHVPTSDFKPTYGGLYVKRTNKPEAVAWMDGLGNDLVMSNFSRVYVRFPAEEKEHKIKARVIQNYFPPKNFEFTVNIKPEFKEVTERVYEEKKESRQ